MSPWWLRPTSEGAANEENEPKKAHDPAATAPDPANPAQEAATDAAAQGVGQSVPGAAASTQASPSASPASPSSPAAADAPTPASKPAIWMPPASEPAAPEPYRSFWQPRPSQPSAETAAAEDRAASGGDLAAPSHTHSQEPAGGSSESAAAASARVEWEPVHPSPAAAPAPASAHHSLAAVPGGSAAQLDPLDADADGDADADTESDGEGDAEEVGGEENRPAGARKKRSRRSRGGRRKNGRAAAGAGAEAGDDEDDDLAPLALDEALSIAPPAPAATFLPSAAPMRSGRSGESYVISAADLEPSTREIIISVPDRQRPQHEERKIAVFCDFENIALGVRDSEISKLDINLILERLLEKGKIIVKKAYADWERYSDYKRPFHEAAIELIDIPQKYYSGKNSADIKMVVDAMDLSYAKEHLDTFVILSGDSDFSPLVSKLKENNKYVIGIGVKNSSSNLLVDNCDEFIYYEDIWRDSQKGPKLDGLSKKTAEAFSLMVESIQALVRENKDVLWGSMIKQTMQRKKPSFNEGYYGYSTFSELLEDAERKSIVKLKKDQRSGTYIVTGFAKTSDAGGASLGSGRRQA